MPQLRSRKSIDYSALRRPRNDLIKVVVESKEIECSRSKLISQSEYFKVMFARYFREADGAVILKEIKGTSMQQLLGRAHNESYAVESGELGQVIVLSDMFLFDSLKTKLISEAYQRLTESNCLSIWLKLEILSIIPLIWKAKSLSLTTFAYQCDTRFILDLELPELIFYLGNPHLQCGSEMNVFKSIMEWSKEHKKRVSESFLKETLCCISYRDISLSELSELMQDTKISKYNNIIEILQNISRLKCGEEVRIINENCKIARTWFSSRGRYLPEYLCMFNYDGYDIFYHAHHKDRFLRKIASVCPKLVEGLIGGEVQTYKNKIYIFGGEFTMGRGVWNEKFWQFDLRTKRLFNTRTRIDKRRHFKSCVVGDNLFIMGGTGAFRVRKENMLWFNFPTKKWIGGEIALPCSQVSMKHCNFNGNLFILDCQSKIGFIFKLDKSWHPVKMSGDVQELMEEYSNFSIFSYRENLFFKGKRLLKLELVDDIIVLKDKCDLPYYQDDNLIDTAVNNNRVYSLYSNGDAGVRMHYLDLNTSESVFVDELLLYYDCDTENSQTHSESNEEIIKNCHILNHKANNLMKMFFLQDYRFCGYEDLLVGDD